MNWLRKLLPEQHSRDCIFVLRALRSEWEHELAWEFVEQRVSKAIRDNPTTLKAKILNDGDTPKNVVLTLVANVCLDEAGSGRNHTYRGTLSLTGSSYRSLFYKAVDQQCDLGFISLDERNQARENLSNAIKEAG